MVFDRRGLVEMQLAKEDGAQATLCGQPNCFRGGKVPNIMPANKGVG